MDEGAASLFNPVGGAGVSLRPRGKSAIDYGVKGRGQPVDHDPEIAMNVTFFWLNLGCPVGFSLGVGLLSGELKAAGHRVQVLHLSEALGYPYDEARIAADLEAFETELVAVSFGGNHLAQAEELVSFLHRRFASVPLVCGGIQATLTPELVLSWPGVDYLCRGEADGGRFADFVSRLAAGEDVSDSQSFWCRQGAAVARNEIGPLPDISGPSHMDLDAFDLGRIIALNRGFAEITVGRGCPKRCAYCHNGAVMDLYRQDMVGGFRTGDYLRLRSVDDLLAELSELVARHGHIRAFNITDDALATDRAWFAEFARRYRQEVGLPFVANASVHQIDEDMADLLAAAGCNMIKLGIECGSERVRREILGKHLSTPGLFEAVRLLRARDINVRGYIMIGMPTETRAEMLETFRLCARLRLDTTRLAVLFPYPGTELHRFCVQRGLLKDEPIPTNYLSDSVLRWEDGTDLFIHKCRALNHWIMNSFLENEAATGYAAVWEQALAMSHQQWQRPDTTRWIQAETARLSAQLRAASVEHYEHPFAERPDAAYLIRDRRVKILNVDDDEP